MRGAHNILNHELIMLTDRMRPTWRNLRAKASNMVRNSFAPKLYDFASQERIGVVFLQPSDMELVDRIMLYALIRGLKPSFVYEVGIRYGCGARIIASALEDNKHGLAIGIDPSPDVFRVPKRHLYDRYIRHTGYSPADTPSAIAKLGGKIDLMLIDAIHTKSARYADFVGAWPYLADGAHVIFHGAFHQGVATAVDQILIDYPDCQDLGTLTREAHIRMPVSYQGFRVVRKGTATEAKHLIEEVYRSSGIEPPPFHPLLHDYDEFANSIGQGADVEKVAELLGHRTKQN